MTTITRNGEFNSQSAKANRRRTFILAVAIALAAFGRGSIVHAITNGQPDGDQHPYVAMTYNGAFTCSASAITPTVVLTAAHCATAPGSQVLVTFDSQADPALPPTWRVGTIYPHPDWCVACEEGVMGFNTHDIAVIVLDEPVNLAAYAELPSVGFVDSLPRTADLAVVGYGIHGWNRGGGRPFFVNPDQDFMRYFALTSVVPNQNPLSDEFLNLTANPGQGKGGVCFGDSGGPVLLGDVILGVTSFVHNQNCAGNTYSNRIDLDYALEFILSFLE